MINEPLDQDYRELVWQQLLGECGSADPSLLLPNRTSPSFIERKNVLIDAEIERRRISMIQRANHGRMARGKPLVEP
jgi:hypothetical protein